MTIDLGSTITADAVRQAARTLQALDKPKTNVPKKGKQDVPARNNSANLQIDLTSTLTPERVREITSTLDRFDFSTGTPVLVQPQEETEQSNPEEATATSEIAPRNPEEVGVTVEPPKGDAVSSTVQPTESVAETPDETETSNTNLPQQPNVESDVVSALSATVSEDTIASASAVLQEIDVTETFPNYARESIDHHRAKRPRGRIYDASVEIDDNKGFTFGSAYRGTDPIRPHLDPFDNTKNRENIVISLGLDRKLGNGSEVFVQTETPIPVLDKTPLIQELTGKSNRSASITGGLIFENEGTVRLPNGSSYDTRTSLTLAGYYSDDKNLLETYDGVSKERIREFGVSFSGEGSFRDDRRTIDYRLKSSVGFAGERHHFGELSTGNSGVAIALESDVSYSDAFLQRPLRTYSRYAGVGLKYRNGAQSETRAYTTKAGYRVDGVALSKSLTYGFGGGLYLERDGYNNPFVTRNSTVYGAELTACSEWHATDRLTVNADVVLRNGKAERRAHPLDRHLPESGLGGRASVTARYKLADKWSANAGVSYSDNIHGHNYVAFGSGVSYQASENMDVNADILVTKNNDTRKWSVTPSISSSWQF